MAANNTSARLDYLYKAAGCLKTKAPTISALLESQYDRTTFENRRQRSETRSREICGSCGSPLGPECAKPSSNKTFKRREREPTDQDQSPALPLTTLYSVDERVMVYECPKCNAKTRIPLPTQSVHKPVLQETRTQGTSLMNRTTSGLEKPKTPIPLPLRVDPGPVSPKANGKRRAQARKSGGLQAILAKSKESPRSEDIGGLDLMDFMKSV